ncbi:MAG: Hypothetical protein BHV28_13450 [Candidatus Tokpelaia hoelldobleri]|uniref:Tetratricopeptide repeat protein n=1 Tax=Candidatus Tokpelaia hoelldobleri TaxID=1902579 RepID=A0A1U9JW00_9HYPH|nr:MAG: Hypothetical protein BHV28_13450 [Candidatus Tokpelaia hoelldoblerii]
MTIKGAARAYLQEQLEEADLALTLKIRGGKTPLWAAAHTDYATALAACAAEEAEPEAFDYYARAVSAYEQALQVYTSAGHSREWLATTLALSRLLRHFGTREGGDMGFLRLLRATKQIETALADRHEPPARAALLVELAHTHRACADNARKSKRGDYLKQAIACYEQAGQIFKLREQAENWSNCLVGQAMAWRTMGEEHFAHAARLLQGATSFYDRASQPMDWSYIHFEYGRTLLQHANRLDGEERLQTAQDAVTALRIAQQTALTLENVEFRLRLHNELGIALGFLAQYKTGKDSILLLEEAIRLLERTIRQCDPQSQPLELACTHGNLGKSLLALAAENTGSQERKMRARAIKALQTSLTPALKSGWRQEWFGNLVELGNALHFTANHETSHKRFALLRRAAKIYLKALQHLPRGKAPEMRMRLYSWQGLALACCGENDKTEAGDRQLKQAEISFRLALAVYQGHETGDCADYARLQSNIGNLYYTMARRADDDTAALTLRHARHAMEEAIAALNEESPELATAHWNYGLTLKHGLLRDLSEDAAADYQTAELAFRTALASPVLEEDPADYMSVKHALATLLLMQAQELPQNNMAGITEAIALFAHIKAMAREHGHMEFAGQIDGDMEQAQQMMDEQRPRCLFSTLRRWFRS